MLKKEFGIVIVVRQDCKMQRSGLIMLVAYLVWIFIALFQKVLQTLGAIVSSGKM